MVKVVCAAVQEHGEVRGIGTSSWAFDVDVLSMVNAEVTFPDLRRGAHEEVQKELAEFAEVCLVWTSYLI